MRHPAASLPPEGVLSGDYVSMAKLVCVWLRVTFLRAFENQELKEHPIVVHGHAPFLIVIGDGRFGRSPRTTRHVPTMHDRR